MVWIWFVRPCQTSCWYLMPSVGGGAKWVVFRSRDWIPHEWLGAVFKVMREFSLCYFLWEFLQELVVKKTLEPPLPSPRSLSCHIVCTCRLPFAFHQEWKLPETSPEAKAGAKHMVQNRESNKLLGGARQPIQAYVQGIWGRGMEKYWGIMCMLFVHETVTPWPWKQGKERNVW